MFAVAGFLIVGLCAPLGPAPGLLAVAPAAADPVVEMNRSYHPSYPSTTSVQSLYIVGDANAAGGDGTYKLTDGTRTTASIHHQASGATVAAALSAAGFGIASVTGGSGAAVWPGSIRWDIVFSSDPGVLISMVDMQYARSGGTKPGQYEVQCVYCLDVYPPTGTPNGAALIYIHPGALLFGTKDTQGYLEAMAPFRAAGYLTVSLNHRLASAPEGGSTACEIDGAFPAGSSCEHYARFAETAASDVQLAAQWLTDNASTYGLTPGKVGAFGGSSGGTVAATSLYVAPAAGRRKPVAAISVAGALRDAVMTAGSPPLLLGAFTADPGVALTGTMGAPEAQEAVGKSRFTGTYVEARIWPGRGHVPEPVPMPWGDTTPEHADMVATASAFLNMAMFGGPARPSSQWVGGTAPVGLARAKSSMSFYRRPTETIRPITGDFDANGTADILWYAEGAFDDTLWLSKPADGTFTTAFDTGVPFSSATPIVNQTGTYPNVVVGDFDGNGRDDVIFDGSSAELWRFGLLAKNRPTVAALPSTVDPAAVPVVGDYDGDGIDDVLWYGAGAVTDHLWYGSAGGSFVDAGALTITAPPATASPKVGDMDGDGRSDIIWHSQGFTAERMWWGNTRTAKFTAAVVLAPATSWDTQNANFVEVGDFNGDGRDDLLAIGSGLAADVLIYGTANRSGSRQVLVWLGTASPVVVDITGDGLSDVYWNATGAAISNQWFGAALGFTSASGLAPNPGSPLAGHFDGLAGSVARARGDLFWY